MEDKNKVLVVDDDKINRHLMKAKLTPLGYDTYFATNGEEAIVMAKEICPDVMLVDVMMPNMNGFELTEILKNDKQTESIPIVIVSALQDVKDRVKALDSGADDFLAKPVDTAELRARVKSLVKVKAYNDFMQNNQKILEKEIIKKTKALTASFEQLQKATFDSIFRLAKAAEYRDEDTGEHIARLSYYAQTIAQEMELDEPFCGLLLHAVPMHDIGKIGIPDRILLKPDKLTYDEIRIMEQHTQIGASILTGSNHELLKLAEEIALSHHEKWNGKGYPNELKENDIPLSGRITAIVDVFDALTSKRPYKKAFAVDESLKIIQEGRGEHFDPTVTDAFFASLDTILEIKEKYSTTKMSPLFEMNNNTSTQQDKTT